ncbi:13855_t:CDS:2 [Funneliformis mosseae]|uniref:13855_t:CDS:1 n=1 Tax=Funneliformis mosseae TaxID=27381 RepID=A0A9N8ZQV4_FUNMO|nr:13855_t:CDS:2 [Funneliformis mosseae]
MPKVQNILHRMTLPFPPNISVDELLEKSRNNNSQPGKVPNCFLIYRLVWVEQIKRVGIKLDLSEISSFVGHKWKCERKEVTDYYRKLSSDAKTKFRTNSKPRFIFHNKCELNNAEQPQDDASTDSLQTPEGASPGASYFHFPMDINHSFSDQDPTMDYFAGLTNGMSFEADPSMHQGCSLKESINEMLRLIFAITPETYSKLHNREGVITSEELERIKFVLEYNRSMISEQSKSSSKCTLLNHMSAIKARMNQLEYATSDAFIDIKNNFNDSQMSFGFDPTREMYESTPQDLAFNAEGNVDRFTQSEVLHQQALFTPTPSEHFDFTDSQFNHNYPLLLRRSI